MAGQGGDSGFRRIGGIRWRKRLGMDGWYALNSRFKITHEDGVGPRGGSGWCLNARDMKDASIETFDGVHSEVHRSMHDAAMKVAQFVADEGADDDDS